MTPNDTFRFCWLRESKPGHLDHDAGIVIDRSHLLLALLGLHPAQARAKFQQPVTVEQVVTALTGPLHSRSLPRWAMRRLSVTLGALKYVPQRAHILVDVAARLTALAASESGAVELHLPYLARRDWLGRFHLLASTRFVLRGSRILPEPLVCSTERLNDYTARRIAALSADPVASAPVAASVVLQTQGPLLDAFIPVAARPAFIEHRAGAEIELALNPSACRAWNRAPIETSGAYFPVHAHVSVAIQSALRRWLPFLWFRDFERYQDVPVAQAMLAYAASSPFPGRRRIDFTYDVFGSDWQYSMFIHARRPLQRMLRSVRFHLAAAGYDEIAEYYYPSYSKHILARVRREKRCLHSLVAAEGDIVNLVLRFGLELAGLTDARAASSIAGRYMRSLNAKLRRYFCGHDFTPLGTVLLLEATNALHMALGGENALRTRVRATEVTEVLRARCA